MPQSAASSALRRANEFAKSPNVTVFHTLSAAFDLVMGEGARRGFRKDRILRNGFRCALGLGFAGIQYEAGCAKRCGHEYCPEHGFLHEISSLDVERV